MLCQAFTNSVIPFKSFFIRRILYKIWQFIPKFTTRIWKTISVYLFVDSRKIKVHWTRFPGVVTMDIKMHISAIRKIVRGDSMNNFEH